MSGCESVVYKIAVCDDEADYVSYLKDKICALFPEQAEFFFYSSGEALLMDAEVMHDLVFLDIQMAGLDGNETAKRLRTYNKGAVLVFCSGVCQPTPESIKVAPFRYLLKSYSEEETDRELMQIFQKLRSQPRHEYLIVKVQDELRRVSVFDIVYISKLKRGSQVHLADAGKETYLSAEHISGLYQRLSGYGFALPHDSYLVNCRWVRAFRRDYITMDDGSENGLQLNIARSKKESFKSCLIAYWDKNRK